VRNGRVFLVIFLIKITLVISTATAQQWSMVCHPDYYIELHNFWNEEEKEIEIVVAVPTQNSSFSARITVSGNHRNGVHFPFDFAPQLIDSVLLDQVVEITITAYSKRNKIAYLEVLFDPAENIGMQLELANGSLTKMSQFAIWGNLIDKYSWVDKTGDNLIIRSQLTHTILQKEENLYRHYVYMYHFRKNDVDEQWSAVKKYTDVIALCNKAIFQPFDLSYLYLTDINKDGIGEINFRYTMNCPTVDSIPLITKTVLITDGKRYSTTTRIEPTDQPLFTLNLPYKYDPIFERYLKRIASNFP